MFKKHKQLRGFWNCFPRVAPSTTREMVLNALHRKEEKLNREYFFSFRKGEGIQNFPRDPKKLEILSLTTVQQLSQDVGVI